MTLSYRPTTGITINGKEINWGEDRKTARKKVDFKYKADDRVIDLSQYNDGDASKNIDVKRDIYGGTDSLYYFFLNYTTSEVLDSIEIHWAAPVQIGPATLEFNERITVALDKLDQIDRHREQLSAGEFFYPKLKLVIASSEVMGGDGDGLAYIYCSDNVDHLREDID